MSDSDTDRNKKPRDERSKSKFDKELQRGSQILILFKEDRINEEQLVTYFKNVPKFMRHPINDSRVTFSRGNSSHFHSNSNDSASEHLKDDEAVSAAGASAKRKRGGDGSQVKNFSLATKATALFQLDALGEQHLGTIAGRIGVPPELLAKWSKPNFRNRIIAEWKATIIDSEREGHSKKRREDNDGTSNPSAFVEETS